MAKEQGGISIPTLFEGESPTDRDGTAVFFASGSGGWPPENTRPNSAKNSRTTAPGKWRRFKIDAAESHQNSRVRCDLLDDAGCMSYPWRIRHLYVKINASCDVTASQSRAEVAEQLLMSRPGCVCVTPLDNISNTRTVRRGRESCSKYFVAYSLSTTVLWFAMSSCVTGSP